MATDPTSEDNANAVITSAAGPQEEVFRPKKPCIFKRFINSVDTTDRPSMKFIELTGHGGIWLVIVPSLFFMAGQDKVLKEKLLNFQLALLIDIVINAILKGVFRRPRPDMNVDDQDNILVDKYSMPSGHAARAMLILVFVYANFDITSVYFELLRIWAIFVLASRIFMARHYPSDLVVGIIVGILESFLFYYHIVWMKLQTIFNVINSQQTP